MPANPTPRQQRNHETEHIESVREFNRFYTRTIGVLDSHFLGSQFSLTEVRVLRELYSRGTSTASEIAQPLGLDPGYMSRMLRGFAKRGFLDAPRSGSDRRHRLLSLSRAGRTEFQKLDARQRKVLETMLEPVSSSECGDLVDSMRRIRRILSPEVPEKDGYVLRELSPGDIGWITHRQGRLYYEEYGWDERFEALIAEILSNFVLKFDPTREKAWVAERDGEITGSIFCVAKTRTEAALRLLYVEPAARGLGLGTRLVDECVAFARDAGYRKISLWTNSVLHSARRIYEHKGFRLIKEEKHQSFGKNLVGQNWELDLRSR